MPKLIDWGARFELIREAVVRVAARGGGAAVTIDAVAAELNVSGSTLRRTLASPDVLPILGVEWILRERNFAWFNRDKTVERSELARAVAAVRSEMPRDAEDLDRERAWSALTELGASERIAKIRRERDKSLDALVTTLVSRMTTDERRRDFEVLRLRALMDGLVAASCRGYISIEQMLATYDRHTDELVAEAPGPIRPPVTPSGA
jgi:AcrR family transcriptional regulator